MAVSGLTITWATRVINVAKSYLTPTASPTIFNLDTDQFRLDLKDLEDGETGISYLDTHQHNTEVLLGGVIYARIIEIINGYTVTFEDGQYAVNLFGSNNNIGDVVNINQVSVRTNNAAGLIVDPGISESLDYGDSITYDDISGSTGTRYPIGTKAFPVNNIADLKELLRFYKRSSVELINGLTATDNFIDTHFYCLTADETLTTSGFSFQDCSFKNIKIEGDFNHSLISAVNCTVGNIQRVGGVFDNVDLFGTITMSEQFPLTIKHSVSTIPGTISPIIDMVLGQPSLLNLRNYSGGITIINADTSGDTSTIEMSQGKVHLEPSCTDGLIDVRGVAYLDDRSSGTTVLTNALLDPSNLTLTGATVDADQVAGAVWDLLTASGNTDGSFGALLLDLVDKSDTAQHSLNVQTEMLKNKPNNC